MAKKITRQQAYEAKGGRPGKPISTRLTDEELRAIDAQLAPNQKRAAWLLALIRRELRLNAPPPKRRKKQD